MYSSKAVNESRGGATVALEQNEAGLVAAATNGDSAAFEVLALRYRRFVLAFTCRMTGSLIEAEDLTQQTLMKAFKNVSKFGGRCSFSTWLMSIAVNEARIWHRKAYRYREVKMTELSTRQALDSPLDFRDRRPNQEASYSKQELSQLLLSEVGRLKPGTREVLTLSDLEEQSTAAAAVLLGISPAAVKSRRLRGRKLLRNRLGRLSGSRRRTGRGTCH